MKRLVTLSMIIMAAASVTINAQLVQLTPEEMEKPSPQGTGWLSLHQIATAARYLEKKADALNEYASSKLGVSPKTTATGVAIATTASPLGIFTGGLAPAATTAYAFVKHLRDKWSSMNETQKQAAIERAHDLVEQANDELNTAEEKVHAVPPTPTTSSSARRSRFIV